MQSHTFAGQHQKVLVANGQFTGSIGRQTKPEFVQQRDKANLHLHSPEAQSDTVARSIAETQKSCGVSLQASGGIKAFGAKFMWIWINLWIVVYSTYRNKYLGAALQNYFILRRLFIFYLVVLGGNTLQTGQGGIFAKGFCKGRLSLILCGC